jgi:hypothetical protein
MTAGATESSTRTSAHRVNGRLPSALKIGRSPLRLIGQSCVASAARPKPASLHLRLEPLSSLLLGQVRRLQTHGIAEVLVEEIARASLLRTTPSRMLNRHTRPTRPAHRRRVKSAIPSVTVAWIGAPIVRRVAGVRAGSDTTIEPSENGAQRAVSAVAAIGVRFTGTTRQALVTECIGAGAAAEAGPCRTI